MSFNKYKKKPGTSYLKRRVMLHNKILSPNTDCFSNYNVRDTTATRVSMVSDAWPSSVFAFKLKTNQKTASRNICKFYSSHSAHRHNKFKIKKVRNIKTCVGRKRTNEVAQLLESQLKDYQDNALLTSLQSGGHDSKVIK